MKTINLNLDLAEMTPSQIASFAAFVMSFAPEQTPLAIPVPVPPLEIKTKKATKEVFIDSSINADVVPAKTEPEPEPSKTEPTVKLEDVRAMLGEKIGDHRDKIRAKLSELDAKNVSVMKPENYDEFYSFLKDL